MKIALLASALLLPLTGAAQQPPSVPQAPPEFPMHPTPNLFNNGPAGCQSVLRQVAGEDRPAYGTRLDQQPPAQLLYAVDRQVGGCREVTFVHGRSVGPMPAPASPEQPRR